MNDACHRMVFRDDRQYLPSERLISELRALLQQIIAHKIEEDLLLNAFLRSSELECALDDSPQDAEPQPGSDGDAPHTRSQLRRVNDHLAFAMLDREQAGRRCQQALALLSGAHLPPHIFVSPPEGYCYYALHPFDYVSALDETHLPAGSAAMVVGIRAMGTSLSAICAAALRKKEFDCDRVTVRPTGHAYDRSCSFSEEQLRLIEHYKAAQFLIVDEGPGFSGSSFLSVGDALVAAGIAIEQVTFICSHAVKVAALVAPNAAQRWSKFRTIVAFQKHNKPEPDAVPLYGGGWRDYVFSKQDYRDGYAAPDDWPAVWTQMSSPKFLSADKSTFFKYVGLGRYGEEVRLRIRKLADDGFAVPALAAANGFVSLPWVNGRLLSAQDVTMPLLERVADYLDYRARAFPSSEADHGELEKMTRFNIAQAFAETVIISDVFRLDSERPVIADGRMMPYEWLLPEGEDAPIKLDSATHGANHFYPGPVDIAWDVAGTIIEWQLNYAATDFLLERYKKLSGDNVGPRLDTFLMAYAAFHEGYSRMAASVMEQSDPHETRRMLRDNLRYRKVLESLAEGGHFMSKNPQSLKPPRIALPA